MMNSCRYNWIAVCALVLACQKNPASERDSGIATITPGAPEATAGSSAPTSESDGTNPMVITLPAPRSTCPHDGKWALCSVERRLTQAGFVVKPVAGDAASRAGFSVTPVVYTLGRGRVELFIYADSLSLANDIARMDTVQVAPRGTPGAWESTPTLVRSGNLAAVLMTQNQRQMERFALAITAGAPQPGSPR